MNYNVDELIRSKLQTMDQQSYLKNDLIEESKTLNNVYVQYTPIHLKEWQEFTESSSKCIIEHISLPKCEFIELYNDFMSKKSYDYKNKKMRYAIKLRVLYPYRIVEQKREKQFIKEFIKEVTDIHADFPFFVYEESVRSAKYAVIIFIEREFINKETYAKYERDIVLDSRSGEFARKDCPSEFRYVRFKKGDLKLDKDGKPILLKAVFSKNQRVFNYGKELGTGRNLFDEFISSMKRKVINACLIVMEKAAFKGKILPKRTNKVKYHNYTKRKISILNYAKSVIQKTTNIILENEAGHSSHLQRYNDAKGEVIIKTEAYKKTEAVFEKYKARFKKQQFHDNNKQLRKFRTFSENVYELEQNTRLLLNMFFDEINKIELSK